MSEFKIRLIQNQQEKEEMYYQRWLVLRKPIDMDIGTEKDEYDDYYSLYILLLFVMNKLLVQPDCDNYLQN